MFWVAESVEFANDIWDMLCNFLYAMTRERKVGDIVCSTAENDFVDTQVQV